MDKVFLLQHSYDYGDDLEHEETKHIGIYSKRSNAEAVIEQLKDKEGFRDYPLDCFYISECVVNPAQPGWHIGFVKYHW
ncbi:MAG: hypothetical protein FWF59_01515 [Turicibacter sp.]|nr:hypothetical protein [Turicibacter sp.]